MAVSVWIRAEFSPHVCTCSAVPGFERCSGRVTVNHSHRIIIKRSTNNCQVQQYKGAALLLRIPQLEANYADGFGGGVGGPDGRGAHVSGGGGDSRRRASEGVGHPVPERLHPQRRLPPTVRAAPTINPSPSLPVLSIRLCTRLETWTQTRNRQSFTFAVVPLQRIWSICVLFLSVCPSLWSDYSCHMPYFFVHHSWNSYVFQFYCNIRSSSTAACLINLCVLLLSVCPSLWSD